MLLLLLKIWRNDDQVKYILCFCWCHVYTQNVFFSRFCVCPWLWLHLLFSIPYLYSVDSSVPNFFIQGTDLLSPWSPHLPVSDLFSQLGIFILKMDRRAACYSFVLAFVWHNHEFLSLDKPCTFVKYACPIPCPKFWTNAYCFKMFVG